MKLTEASAELLAKALADPEWPRIIQLNANTPSSWRLAWREAVLQMLLTGIPHVVAGGAVGPTEYHPVAYGHALFDSRPMYSQRMLPPGIIRVFVPSTDPAKVQYMHERDAIDFIE